MPSFAAWAPILGPAVAEAAQAYSEATDELSERNQKRAQAAQQQILRPLETRAAQVALQKQIRSADQPTFHPYAGGYALVYPDGRVEPHAWPPGTGVKQTAATRKIQELAELARSSDPLVAAAAKGDLDRLSHPQDPKEFSLRQRWFAMNRQEIPYDAALDNYEQMKILSELGHYPERGFDPSLVPSLQGTSLFGGHQAPGMPTPTGEKPQAPLSPGGTTPGLERLTNAIVGTEASGETAKSPAGALGRGQMLPKTALRYLPPGTTEAQAEAALLNPGTNRYLTMRHLDDLSRKWPGNPTAVFAAYFSGEGNVNPDGTIKDPTLSDGNMTVAQYVERALGKYAGRQTPQPGGATTAAPPTAQPGAWDTQTKQTAMEIRNDFAKQGGAVAKQALEDFRKEAPPNSPVLKAAEWAYNSLYGVQGGTPPTATSTPAQDAAYRRGNQPAVTTAPPQQMAAPAAQAPLLQGRQGQSPRYTAQTVVEEARALGFGKEEIAAAQQLFPHKSFSEYIEADVTQVRRVVEGIKNDKAFRQVFHQAAPLIGELNSMDESIAMAEAILPVITPEHVGTQGWLNRKKQSLLTINPTLAKQYGVKYDPAFQDLDTFQHIIGNVHANAVKRLGSGGGGRSAIKYDVESVTKLFNPYGWTTSAEDVKAQLASIQKVLRLARPFVENDLRALGVDPKTKGPLPGRNYGGVVIPTGETPTPQEAPAAPETTEPTGNDLLGRE